MFFFFFSQNPPSSGGSSNNYRLLAARQICRPQSKFSDDIDNRNRPFVPNIRRKPNALKLLEGKYKTLYRIFSLETFI